VFFTTSLFASDTHKQPLLCISGDTTIIIPYPPAIERNVDSADLTVFYAKFLQMPLVTTKIYRALHTILQGFETKLIDMRPAEEIAVYYQLSSNTPYSPIIYQYVKRINTFREQSNPEIVWPYPRAGDVFVVKSYLPLEKHERYSRTLLKIIIAPIFNEQPSFSFDALNVALHAVEGPDSQINASQHTETDTKR
jgi:hypothetical protein